jgi:hypothetical protein
VYIAVGWTRYDSLPTAPDVRQNPAISLMALQVRRGDVSAARSLILGGAADTLKHVAGLVKTFLDISALEESDRVHSISLVASSCSRPRFSLLSRL